MSVASKGSIADQLEHEVTCLEAIDVALQCLHRSDISGHERAFAHLVQDRVDRLREIQSQVELAPAASPISGHLPRPQIVDLLDAFDCELRRARGILAALLGLKDVEPHRQAGVVALMEEHVARLEDIESRLDAMSAPALGISR